MLYEKSIDTKILEDLLSKANVGDLVTYELMSVAIGRSVRDFALPSLRSARQGLLNTKNMVFGVEKNVGVRRLNDSQIVKAAEHDRKKMKRAATKAIRKLSVVDFDKLTPEEKKQHTVASAQMGVIAMFSSKRTTTKITENVNDKAILAIGETLKMFS